MKALRVLVLEDETLIAMLLADVLEEMGYEVCAIEASEIDAVAGALRCDPDLLIVDAQLSDGSGVSAVAQILRTGFIPHVFISGDVARVTALRPDAVVVQKPFTDTDLARAIQRVLASAAAS